ncbi:MAG: Lrp/AsnC ligand binding domain-containing protein [Nitrosopumilus sp.]|nr:Lrp/AsnC ligand binding domain-containing protein [Nitrosopumilus sp.]MDH3516122.1 Lrp/AsnC ligand binding domain-containing protein [Nitrosopumilus sp.]MDH3564609.1 Lrp/AsnC ligand binding domain-containing protein [Nitrosopumilus sp.]MDH5418258.1 Lrp/AsnC ligand binding domain-containing protein [Nitrosopumilus sp.]MDH5555596.1 Lrp/AsnC ligand binding domain-containing protein [Nitrosopumilus sp.]
MEIAHILVKCDDENDDVLDELQLIDGVKEVKKTFGAYNAVVKLEAETVSKIKNIISDKIRNKRGVLSTLTLVTA